MTGQSTTSLNFATLATSSTSLASVVAPFSYTIPQILIYRFIMNLRLASHSRKTTSELGGASRLDSGAASIIFGNMGEPLEYGPHEDYSGGHAEVNEEPGSDHHRLVDERACVDAVVEVAV
ncbi:hypothetical protein PsYK624_011820 [Phanerochaete sordida]|uniref:Uncharacterized protein n=1 Tax=Phanerochaete sordida TaxID=48140 RepID=A0A9P3L7L5_9APHY|nr:hypothetical protein PsYK624_011820 [Phanerochaete sordida]